MDVPRTTQYAQKALDLATAFGLACGNEELAGGYRVEMAAPDGPSTGGGKQAVQHISLVSNKGGPAIVVGSANHGAMTAELRTFEFLAAAQARRTPSATLSFDAAAYGQLVRIMQDFLTTFGLAIKVVEAPGEPAPSSGPASAPAPASGNWKLWAAVGAGALIILAAVLFHH